MKASELRIGNLCIQYGDICPIESGEEIDDCAQYPDKYEPIPLTEEWLLKFGFQKITGWSKNEFCSLHTGYIEFQWDKDGMMISIEDQNLTLSHIKYVHSLQNLFFSLTGNELTLNK